MIPMNARARRACVSTFSSARHRSIVYMSWRRPRWAPTHSVFLVDCVSLWTMNVAYVCVRACAVREVVCGPFFESWHLIHSYDPVCIVITFTHEHSVVIVAFATLEGSGRVTEERKNWRGRNGHPKFRLDLLALFAQEWFPIHIRTCYLYFEIVHNEWHTTPSRVAYSGIASINDFSISRFFSQDALFSKYFRQPCSAQCCMMESWAVNNVSAPFNWIVGWTLLYCHFDLMKSSRYFGNHAINVW